MKLMSPKAFYYTVGKKRNFFQYILFGIFVLFFYLPLMNLCMLAFADKYEVPAIIPQKFGFRWWEFVLGQGSLLSSIATSFVLAVVVTAVSLLICIPAAYALARYNFKGKRVFLLSFLLSNAYPRMGLYISIGILFYRLNLMGTFVGVVIIHVLNSMMFMTWIPSGAFRGVYRQQEESARDAGAGPFRTFFRITLPLAMPGIAVASVFTFLGSLEEAFKDGVKLFLFSNPNNPVGCVYSYEEITGIAALAKKYGVTLIVDELYSRQVYPGIPYTHLCAQKEIPENLITIQGPSKTESLSGFRLGAAFGTAEIIERMEKLQAIMALRCSGYNQAVFLTWFNEPEGWLEARIKAHKEIREAVMEVIRDVPGVSAKPTEGGSYLFVTIPELDVSLHQFIRIARELADVIVTPGTEFGPQYVHQFRINFSQDKENAAAAMKRLFAVMERYRKQ